jgi:predicted outer membrane lipoprotein
MTRKEAEEYLAWMLRLMLAAALFAIFTSLD